MSAIPSIAEIRNGNPRAIARALTIIENSLTGCDTLLEQLDMSLSVPVIGLTGAPGAGKSSLVNALAERWLNQGLKVAVLAVDPASPFNFGSILGDRLRLAGLFMNPNIFIRSVSTRGSLGGLSASIIELTELLRNAGFDRIIIETVGVGQSEVEVAGIADTTIVVTVPEGGDEVQAMKSGIMEIADIFVVNKSDRDGAHQFARYLEEISHARSQGWKIPVIQTVATDNTGIDALDAAIIAHNQNHQISDRKYLLLAEKVESLVIRRRMQDFDLNRVAQELKSLTHKPGFNLYNFAKQYFQS